MKKLVKKEMIFGYSKEGLVALEEADVDRLVELIFTLGILIHTKAYLFLRVDCNEWDSERRAKVNPNGIKF